MKQLLFLLLIITANPFAQITITSADINAQFTIGNSFTIKTDTITNQVDIGQLGSTSWDFSFFTLNPSFDTVTTVVDPNSTPYSGWFPGSNISTKRQINSGGFIVDTYSFFSVNGSFNYHGSVIEDINTSWPTTIEPDPIEPMANLPFTFGSTANYNGIRERIMWFEGYPWVQRTTVVSNSVVDAYGPMTLPGGRVVDALRIKKDEINIIHTNSIYSRHISYTFLAKDGSQVKVSSDTTQLETGIINNTAYVSWNNSMVSDVKIEEPLPVDYSLSQNYPNPFNPITIIEYGIPEISFVEIKVYDVLGNEIVTLVNEQKSAGTYEVQFNAIDLPSGIYFYRIQAGKFIQTIKMVLMK